MAEASYTVRASVMAGPTTWLLDNGDLVRRRDGADDRRWPLAQARRVQIIRGAQRTAGQRTLRIAFVKGVVLIPSHSLEKIGHIVDQTPAFAAFTRAVCMAAARPGLRFDTGTTSFEDIFNFSALMVGLGLIGLLAFSLTFGGLALGVELAARLAFVLCLMLAARPWIVRGGGRFDPARIPTTLLP